MKKELKRRLLQFVATYHKRHKLRTEDWETINAIMYFYSTELK